MPGSARLAKSIPNSSGKWRDKFRHYHEGSWHPRPFLNKNLVSNSPLAKCPTYQSNQSSQHQMRSRRLLLRKTGFYAQAPEANPPQAPRGLRPPGNDPCRSHAATSPALIFTARNLLLALSMRTRGSAPFFEPLSPAQTRRLLHSALSLSLQAALRPLPRLKRTFSIFWKARRTAGELFIETPAQGRARAARGRIHAGNAVTPAAFS